MKKKKHKHIFMALAPVAIGVLLLANNARNGNIVDKNGAHADLVVSKIIIERTAEDGWAYGKTYWVAIVIKNAGTTPVTRPFDIIVKAPGHENGDVQRTNRKFQPNWARWSGPWIEGGKVIMPGEEIGAAWLYPIYLREVGTTYEISAVVDSSSEIRESDENNNELVKRFETYMAGGGVADVRPAD